MIRNAIVILPPHADEPGPEGPVHPLARLGGLTLIQRILYSLRWAGIRRGLVLSGGEWPEVEDHIKQDPSLEAFDWWIPNDPGKLARGPGIQVETIDNDCLVHLPWWIFDRTYLKALCRREAPLEGVIVLESPGGHGSEAEETPPLVLVPQSRAPDLFRTLAQGGAPLERFRLWLEGIRVFRKEEVPETELIRVACPSDLSFAEAQLFQRLIKPTESFLSRRFERRISLAITRRLLYTPITPNQISIGSILLGVASALFFLGEARILHVLGALLLIFSSIVDGCDGELARLRFQESRAGSWLDFLGDNIVHVSVFLCIGFGLYDRGYGSLYVALGCLAALGTLGAATAVFFRVFLGTKNGVITFATPVRVEEMDRAKGSLRRRIEFTDKLSNRDFFYLILIAAAVDKLWIFAWASAFGVLFYFFNLVYLYARMRAIR